jgi:hypothetical protein
MTDKPIGDPWARWIAATPPHQRRERRSEAPKRTYIITCRIGKGPAFKYEVEAGNKKDANWLARRQARADGHRGGSMQCRAILKPAKPAADR